MSECVKHYNRSTAASILNPTYTTYGSTVLRQYSVKLGELIPELMNFQIVDKALFSGSGLEI